MDWTVDYGDGPRPCTVPHAWRQDVDVRWEGPAVYRTQVVVSQPDSWFVFHGVSYQSRVFLNDALSLEHHGIWDAFSVRLPVGQVDVRIEVLKNGGETFPVKDVLSGFLPYVFNTFGGIYREVELVVSSSDPSEKLGVSDKCDPRISVEGTKLFVDGKPWYMRGVLSWGWYPEVGHPNPPIEEIRDEVRKVKALGFNLVKFCLWLPPHSYFQVLEEEDMWAWMELPLWMPSPAMDLEKAFEECERIVRQYRHHDRIVCWTCGCELSTSTPHDFRKRLFEMVRDLTGCPLVKDNSGGSEMYGGDLREYGTFYDFHPYCDTQFYPVVLDSLMIGPRKKMPVLLGEFNDYDVYRPLGPLRGLDRVESHSKFPWVLVWGGSDGSDKSDKPARPYWASSDPRLNDQGVRWQHDLPRVLDDKTKKLPTKVEEQLAGRAVSRSGWIRECVTKTVMSHDDIAGMVITGLVDTPISTSGVSCGNPSSGPREGGVSGLLEDLTVFIIPFRHPPWIDGGNRPGWSDVCVRFPGRNSIRLGARSTKGFIGEFELAWSRAPRRTTRLRVELPPNVPVEILEFSRELSRGQRDILWVTPIHPEEEVHLFSFFAEEKFRWDGRFDWSVKDPRRLLCGDRIGSNKWTVSFGPGGTGQRGLVFLTDDCTLPMPFWRENLCTNSSEEGFFRSSDHLYPVATDRVIDPAWLDSELPGAEWLLTRVDTRTYARHPYVARKGKTVVTTLRPWGGLGAQPYGLDNNPAGCELLRILMRLAEEG